MSTKTVDTLTVLYKVVSDNTNAFISMMKTNDYYDHPYENTNEMKCRLLLQRLDYINQGLQRIHTMGNTVSEFPYRQTDNVYMKNELDTIQNEVENFKKTIKTRINVYV